MSGNQWKLTRFPELLCQRARILRKITEEVLREIDHMQKVIRHAKYCAFKEGRQKPKFPASQFSSGVCSIEKFVKSGLLQILGNSLDVPQVLWRAQDFPLGMHQCSNPVMSGNQWKLTRFPELLCQRARILRKITEEVLREIDHMQKVIRHAKYCAFKEGRQKPKFPASQFSSGVCSIEKFVKSGLLQILGNSLDVPQVLWRAQDFPLGMHHHAPKLEGLFVVAALQIACFRVRFRIGAKLGENAFSIRSRLQN